mgnify:CR=1 FL=1
MNKKILTKLIGIIIILIAALTFLLYYVGKYNFYLDFGITLILLYYGIDNLLYLKHTKKYKTPYLINGLFCVVLAIVHISRLIFGPLQCKFLPVIVSLFTYDVAALLMGASLIYFSSYSLKHRSGQKYLHIFGIIIGAVIVIDHVIRIAVGKCV